MLLFNFTGLRAAALSACLVAAFALPAAAASMRPATKAEIEKHLGPNAAGKTSGDGFTYKPGSTKGYKVGNGQICIRYPDSSTHCAAITTDGSSFRMSTPGGSSAPF